MSCFAHKLFTQRRWSKLRYSVFLVLWIDRSLLTRTGCFEGVCTGGYRCTHTRQISGTRTYVCFCTDAVCIFNFQDLNVGSEVRTLLRESDDPVLAPFPRTLEEDASSPPPTPTSPAPARTEKCDVSLNFGPRRQNSLWSLYLVVSPHKIKM